jgi:hypothetical protein
VSATDVLPRQAEQPRTVICCPQCHCPLERRWDMWGPFRVCEACGFAAEDDDRVCVCRELEIPPPSREAEVIETATGCRSGNRG